MIYYIFRKKICEVSVLNKKSNHIKLKKIFNYNIAKTKKDKLFLIYKYMSSIIIHIIKDNKEQFLIKKKLQISKNKIHKIIKKYYNKPLQYYLRINQTL